MMRKFTKVVMYDRLFDFDSGEETPSKVNRRTGELQLNRRMWRKMPPEQKAFTILHELGHLTLQTKDEFRADSFALEQYVKLRFPLKGAVDTLITYLDESDPVHLQRANRIFQQAQQLDTNYKPLNQTEMSKALSTIQAKRPLFDQASEYENFFGKGARERRKERRAKRHERKLQRIDARATGRAKVAAQGGNFGLGKATDVITGIFGGSPIGFGTADTNPSPNNDPNNPPQNNNGMIIILAVVVVGIVLAVILSRRNKAK